MCRIATKTNGLGREVNWRNVTQLLPIRSGGGGRTTHVEIAATFRYTTRSFCRSERRDKG